MNDNNCWMWWKFVTNLGYTRDRKTESVIMCRGWRSYEAVWVCHLCMCHVCMKDDIFYMRYDWVNQSGWFYIRYYAIPSCYIIINNFKHSKFSFRQHDNFECSVSIYSFKGDYQRNTTHLLLYICESMATLQRIQDFRIKPQIYYCSTHYLFTRPHTQQRSAMWIGE